MILKEIDIDGKKVKFRASATVPRLYRRFFMRDIFKDMQKLAAQSEKAKKDGTDFEIDDLEMFENVAYVMAKHLTNGLSSLIHFLYIRFYRRF